MQPQNGQIHFLCNPICSEDKPDPIGVESDLFGAVIAPWLHPKVPRFYPELSPQARQHGVVSVQKQDRILLKTIDDMQLFPQDVLLCLKLLNVGNPDIGDHRTIGRCDLRQTAHFAKIAHPHLHNSDLMLRLQTEHRQRQSDLAVVVSFRTHNLLFRRKGKRDHLFRRRLPDASRHADHRD